MPPMNLLHEGNAKAGLGDLPDARRALVSAVPPAAPPSTEDDLALVFSELATNVIRHSGVGADELFKVRMYGDLDALRIEIEDLGPGFDLPALLPLKDDGRWGLRLVDLFAADWGLRVGSPSPYRHVVRSATQDLTSCSDSANIRPSFTSRERGGCRGFD